MGDNDSDTTSPDEADKSSSGSGGPVEEGATLKQWFLKTAGSIIGLVGLSGSMVLIGSGVLWVRFKEAGIPPVQAVSVQSHDEALAQGAQMTIFFVLIALAVVALLYLVDGHEVKVAAKESEEENEQAEKEAAENKAAVAKKEEEEKSAHQSVPVAGSSVPKEQIAEDPAAEPPAKVPTKQADPHKIHPWTLACIALVPICGIVWAWLGTDLSFEWVVVLGVLAVFMAGGCILLGFDASKNFWALAGAVFVSVIVFSGAAKYLIVKEQKYIQAVAVLGKESPGIAGFYVAANGESLYVATAVGSRAGRAGGKAIQKVELGEGANYLVGPLESIPEAEKTSKALLEQLEGERKGGDVSDLSAASLPSWAREATLNTFGGEVEAHEEVSGEPLCMMRFAGRGQTKVLRPFWTSCAEAEVLATIQDARQRLALPIRFQADYVNRVKVEVPAGTKMRYLEGTVGPQCGGEASEPCGNRYPGGGFQYWIDEPEGKLGSLEVSFECTSTKADQQSVWKPGPCPKEEPAAAATAAPGSGGG